MWASRATTFPQESPPRSVYLLHLPTSSLATVKRGDNTEERDKLVYRNRRSQMRLQQNDDDGGDPELETPRPQISTEKSSTLNDAEQNLRSVQVERPNVHQFQFWHLRATASWDHCTPLSGWQDQYLENISLNDIRLVHAGKTPQRAQVSCLHFLHLKRLCSFCNPLNEMIFSSKSSDSIIPT